MNGLVRDAWRGMWTSASRLERRCLVVGAVLIASGLFHLGVFAVRGGPWEGPVSYRKAVTFGLAFGLTVLTVTTVQRVVTLGARVRRIVLVAFVGACIVEVVLVSMQAWRQVPSHFNRDTAFDSAVSTVLAAGGFVIVAASLVMTVAAVRRPVRATPSLTLAVRAGYLGFLLALVVGAVMIARGVSMERTGSAADAYHHAGSLKPAHADTMHAILILPMIGWLLGRTDRSEASRIRWVTVAVAGYAVTAALVLVESILSVNPLAPSAEAVVSGIGAAVVLVAGLLALRDAVLRPVPARR